MQGCVPVNGNVVHGRRSPSPAADIALYCVSCNITITLLSVCYQARCPRGNLLASADHVDQYGHTSAEHTKMLHTCHGGEKPRLSCIVVQTVYLSHGEPERKYQHCFQSWDHLTKIVAQLPPPFLLVV